MARITGIGGVFLKSAGDGKGLAEWYVKNFGIRLEDFGAAILKWTDDKSEDQGVTVWATAPKDTAWFSPSKASFMINYRVDDMDGIIAQLKQNDVAIHQGPESHENGRFLWVIDPDGNKVELWEPKNWDAKNKQP